MESDIQRLSVWLRRTCDQVLRVVSHKENIYTDGEIVLLLSDALIQKHSVASWIRHYYSFLKKLFGLPKPSPLFI